MTTNDTPAAPRRLPEGIARAMGEEGGAVSFARFMELALIHPKEGYYSRAGGAAGPLLGRRGHFSTAPHISPAFCRVVGRLLTELVDASLAVSPAFAETSRGNHSTRYPLAVVELGGGEGDLARVVLEQWERNRPDLKGRVTYMIVEIGRALRARQREAVSDMVARGWQVRWADDLTGTAIGAQPVIIVGNEFVDSLPVHVIDIRGDRPLEAYVGLAADGGGLVAESWREPSPEARGELQLLFNGAELDQVRQLSRDGFVELRPVVRSLLSQAGAIMRQGCLLTIDYGGWFPGAEGGGRAGCGPWRESRHGRSLRGYFRHLMVGDPYARVGRQDLTADVDFRALDLHGREAGFETVVYTSVAALLQAGGGDEELGALEAKAASSLEADREAGVLAALLDDQDLGGSFKAMLQVKE